MDEYNLLQTEQQNLETTDIDQKSTLEMLELLNKQDSIAVESVKKVLPEIAYAVDRIYEKLQKGGRMIYVGAGSSGLLASLDAFECVPTFGIPEGMVLSFNAGIDTEKSYKTVESAEDDFKEGYDLAEKISCTERDVVVGISASGSSEYVLGALTAAKEKGACTIGIVNNPRTKLSKACQVCIEALTGPEALMGSTRMKAGTAQKLILNMLSTASMINLGMVYQNLMVGVSPRNKKMEDRGIRIVALACGIPKEEAKEIFFYADGNVKLSILMKKTGLSKVEASELLKKSGGNLRKALGEGQKS